MHHLGADPMSDPYTRDICNDCCMPRPVAHFADCLVGRAEKAEAEVARLQAVVAAAVMWWLDHRPEGWTEEEHSARPMVNITRGRGLALALAALRTTSRSPTEEPK